MAILHKKEYQLQFCITVIKENALDIDFEYTDLLSKSNPLCSSCLVSKTYLFFLLTIMSMVWSSRLSRAKISLSVTFLYTNNINIKTFVSILAVWNIRSPELPQKIRHVCVGAVHSTKSGQQSHQCYPNNSDTADELLYRQNTWERKSSCKQNPKMLHVKWVHQAFGNKNVFFLTMFWTQYGKRVSKFPEKVHEGEPNNTCNQQSLSLHCKNTR